MNRTVAPKFSQAQDLTLVFPEKILLENGVQLFWMKDVKDDSVKLDIEWDAGSKYQDQKFVSSFTNKLLLSGTETRNAQSIAEEIDFYGGYSQLEFDKDHAGIVLYGLVDNIESIFYVFTDSFAGAVFPESELKKELDIALNKFRVNLQKVGSLGRRAFTSNLFGPESKYGQIGEEEDFALLKREHLIQYFEDKYSKAPTIFLTGNVSEAFIQRLKEWSKGFTSANSSQIEQRFEQHKGRVDVPKQDAMQAAIRVGRMMFDKNHPDYYPFQLLNTALGGYFGSRLMANIREDKGYTYGIGSGLAVMQDAGYFYITTEVGVEVKENALDEIYVELDRLKNDPIQEDELQKVKNYMLGEFLRQADGPIAMMEMFKNIYFNELKPTYYSDFIAAIHATSAADLQDLARKYFERDEMLEVIAG